MGKILAHEGCHVFEDILPQEQFNFLYQAMQTQVKYKPLSSHEYIAVWEPRDGQLLRGQQIILDIENIPDTSLRMICKPIIEAIKLTSIKGSRSMSLLPYCWPPGTSIKWHTDQHVLGAITYYLHRYWNSEWGGEFLHLNSDEVTRNNNAVYNFVDNHEISETIVNNGVGVWVSPKPNRLIINESGEWHKVAKTTPNAGYRFSIQGFIMNKSVDDLRNEQAGA